MYGYMGENLDLVREADAQTYHGIDWVLQMYPGSG